MKPERFDPYQASILWYRHPSSRGKGWWRPVFVDLDGTIADCSARLPHLAKRPKDWLAFADPKLVAQDAPIYQSIALANALRAAGHPLIFVSGRHEALREVSEWWLDRHGFRHPRLLMRADGDYRDDAVVKREILQWLRQGGVDVWLALDDRPRVLLMWREEGVFPVQVGRAVGKGEDF